MQSLPQALVTEDCCWVRDLALSTVLKKRGDLALIIAPHMMRIAFESSRWLNSLKSSTGTAFDITSSNEIEAARLSLKLLDVNDGPQLLRDFFTDVQEEHRRQFIQPVFRLFRRWARDLGLYLFEGHLVATTASMVFWSGQPAAMMNLPNSGQSLHNQALDAGTMVARVMEVLEISKAPSHALIAAPQIHMRDVLFSDYIRQHFTSINELDRAVLLTIECAVNNSLYLLPRISPDHPGPVFRTQVLTLTHAVASLQHILNNFLTTGRGIAPLKLATDAAMAQLVGNEEFRNLRNSCMHYGVKERTVPSGSPTDRLIRNRMRGVDSDEVQLAVRDHLTSVSEALSTAAGS